MSSSELDELDEDDEEDDDDDEDAFDTSDSASLQSPFSSPPAGVAGIVPEGLEAAAPIEVFLATSSPAGAVAERFRLPRRRHRLQSAEEATPGGPCFQYFVFRLFLV